MSRAKIGLFLGPLLALLVWHSPLTLNINAQHLSSVIVLVITWWVCETLPLAITSLVGICLAVIVGVANAKAAFAPMAHPLIFLFMGGFFIAKAMEVHGLDKRIAFYILTRKWIKGRPQRTLVSLVVVTAFLSMWISNTATTAMLLPISIGVLSAVLSHHPKYKGGVLISVAWGSSIGGIVTPVGSTPNIIAMGLLDRTAHLQVSFLQWMAMTLPIAILCLIVLIFIMRKGLPKLPAQQDIAFIQSEYKKLGKIKSGERNCLIAASFAVLFWMGPSIISVVLGATHPFPVWFKTHMPEAVTAVVAASLLFLLPASRGKPTLEWKQAVHIDWNALILFGGGLSLGAMMFDTGLAQIIGNSFVTLSGGGEHFWVFIIGAVFVSIFLTEIVSNTATASMLLPLVIAASQKAGFNPLLPTMGVAVACSLAFMMPVSTPPNAIVYGSGMVRITQMMKRGIVMNLICGVVIIGVLYVSHHLIR